MIGFKSTSVSIIALTLVLLLAGVSAAATATLDIEDMVLANQTTAGVEVSVFLTSADHLGVTSVGIAVAHNNAEVSACSVSLGVDVPAGVSLQTTQIGSEGVIAGLIVDFDPVLMTIPVGTDLEIFKLCYDTLATGGINTPLTFSNTLMIPNAPAGTFASTEVFAIPTGAVSNISEAIVGPDLTLVNGSIQILSTFVRGDANGDGTVGLIDPILALSFLFLSQPVNCLLALDATDDGTIDLGDPVLILNFFFMGGPPPNPPFPNCGSDPNPTLECLVFPFCP